jgi:outer membrane lipoprotein-sorting protein
MAMKLLSAFRTALAALLLAAPVAQALDDAQRQKLLETIDDRQRNTGDYKALVYLEQKEKNKPDVVREAVVYRRDSDDKMMLLLTRPKGETGKGYLRVEKNLWTYDPNTGKWERRTERERIAGTDTRRADFDESRLAEEFTSTFEGEEKLGQYTTWRLTLKAREGVDVAYPVVKLWVDKASSNVLKRQELALSGRLMRTIYYPKWQKMFSEAKKGEMWYPQQVRIYDEVEKSNSTMMLIKSVDLKPLQDNLFTKAWFESKSR